MYDAVVVNDCINYCLLLCTDLAANTVVIHFWYLSDCHGCEKSVGMIVKYCNEVNVTARLIDVMTVQGLL